MIPAIASDARGTNPKGIREVQIASQNLVHHSKHCSAICLQEFSEEGGSRARKELSKRDGRYRDWQWIQVSEFENYSTRTVARENTVQYCTVC